MKFEPLLKYQNGELICINDNKVLPTENICVYELDDFLNSEHPFDDYSVVGVKVPVKSVEISDGNYNEEILAKFRDCLKNIENGKSFVFVIPVVEKSFETSEDADSVISAMKHTARRIKDCQAVVGFEIPVQFLEKDKSSALDENSWTMWFVSEMSAKHQHYLYFAEKTWSDENAMLAKVSESGFVLYKM
jgi:hypothetical protein